VARAFNYAATVYLAGDLTTCQSTSTKEVSPSILYSPQLILDHLSINVYKKTTTGTQSLSIYHQLLSNSHTKINKMSFGSTSSDPSSTELKNALMQQVQAETATANARALVSVRPFTPH
jgi:hypothetical protein